MRHKILLALLLAGSTVPTWAEVGVAANLSGTASVQQDGRKVTGKVLDENGEPVIGASIKVTGTTTGTITDFDGNFTLNNVPKGAKIEISYIGYLTQTVEAKGNEPLTIKLAEDNQMLDEVVVVGYGTQKAKDVTGSIGVITPKEIEDLPVSNLGAALAGQIPGLSVSGGSGRPGEGATLSIRQSFNYSKDGGNSIPMVVIDDVIQIDPNTGLPTLETFNMLDPSEIESISVLRDASAAIYGSRASQGAIIVKTKRGKSGAPRINYSGKFGVNDAVGHPKVLTGSDYGRFSNSFNLATGKINKGSDGWENKLWSQEELDYMDTVDYDWLDEAWSSAFTMTHSVNVSGGSEKATYFAGASYFTQDANLGKQDYNKWTFRAGVDINLTSDLKFSATISGNQSDRLTSFAKGLTSINTYGGSQSGENGDYKILSHMPHYLPWEITLDDGNTYYTSPIISSDRNAGNAKSNNKIGTWNYFAMNEDDGNYSSTSRFGYDANFSMTYAIPYVKGLSVKGSYALSHSASDTEQVFMPYTLAYLNASNKHDPGHRFYHTHPSVDDYKFDEFTGNTRVVYQDLISKSEQMNFYINYEGKFGKHSITAMAAVEKSKSSQTKKQMLYEKPDPDSFLGTGSTAGTMDTSNSITYKYERGSLSYLGRVTYNYADRYLFQFLFRSDASTKFAPANYWGFFPGISAGWVASEEKFFKDAMPEWFEYLKVRFSWGQTGKDNIKPWKWMQLYSIDQNKGYGFGNNSGVQTPGIKPGATANPDVKWDKTNKYNVGFDMRFFNSRLTANADFYYDINSDILNQNIGSIVGTPIFAGGAISEMNFGRVDAWGGDFSVNWRDKVGQVNYNIGVNFGFHHNKVKEWPNIDTKDYPSKNTTVVGHSTIWPVWGFKVWEGTSTGDGILRNQQDIDNYWNYLTANANGGEVKYLGKNSKDELKPGMLAYQDLGGVMNEDGTQAGPNGQIEKDQDYARLCNRNKSRGFTTKLGAEWKGLTFNMMISASWGGSRQIDVNQIKSSSGDMVWTPDSFWKDMFDEDNNVSGKYPNIGMENRLGGSVAAPSDFWEISTFRCFIRNMSIGYNLPKKWLTPLKIESAKLSITGDNLWDFCNPYPDHYRNMYDASDTAYPTLRTWSLGINVSF